MFNKMTSLSHPLCSTDWRVGAPTSSVPNLFELEVVRKNSNFHENIQFRRVVQEANVLSPLPELIVR